MLLYLRKSVLKKCLPPLLFPSVLDICHTYMFQMIKEILILDKDNASKYKMHFLDYDFIDWGRKGELT